MRNVLQLLSLTFMLGAIGWTMATTLATARQIPKSPLSISTSTAPFAPLAPGEGDTALNWAGYVTEGHVYTSVTGTWVVPAVYDPTGGNSADATWVGIGGTETNDLIQAGTEAVPTYGGDLEYRAWMEMLPGDSIPVPLDISPGDSVTVSIDSTGADAWRVSFLDRTSGKSYAKDVIYSSSLSSAEWIEEMPVAVDGAISLDDFGVVKFSNAYTSDNGFVLSAADSGATPLIMANDAGEYVAVPTELGSDGASFAVQRASADSTPLTFGADPSAAPSSLTGHRRHRFAW